MATYKVTPPIPTEGLILYLDCYNQRSYPGTGNIWYDVSGNNNHFEIQGDITFVDKKGFTNFDGNSGSIGNKIFCTNENFAKELKLGNGGDGYTILTWGNSISSGIKAKIIGFNDSDNYIDLYQNSSSNAFHAEDGSTVYIDGNTVENNGYVLYDSGYHQMGSTNLNSGGSSVSQGVLTIGNEPSGSDAGVNAYPWSGSIAVVMMYNRVLSIEEIRKTNNIITQRFAAKASSVSPDPELVVHLDAGDTDSYPGYGNIWFDTSGNGNHAYKLGIPGTPVITGSAETSSFYFPALTLGPSGGFTIPNSQTIQNLNQATVEIVVSPEQKGTLIGLDTLTQTMFAKDNGTRTQNKPGISFDQNQGYFRIETPTTLGLTSAGNTTVLDTGTVTGSQGMNWTNISTFNSFANTSVPSNYFAVKLEGYFIPKETGTYTFTCEGDDAVDLFVSGTNVANHYGAHGVGSLGSHTGTISLESGSTYTFRARQQEYSGGEGLRVFWRKPSQPSSWFQDNEELSSVTSSIDGQLNFTTYSTHGGNGSTATNPRYPLNASQFDALLSVVGNIPTPSYNENDWYHIVASIDVSTVTAYVNYVSASFSNSMVGNTAPIYIGSDSFTEMFKGKVAAVKFWNRALTDVEVSASYAYYKSRYNLVES